jgi:hypothetical protein
MFLIVSTKEMLLALTIPDTGSGSLSPTRSSKHMEGKYI